MKKYIFRILLLFLIFFLIGCKGPRYQVSFDLGYENADTAPPIQKIYQGDLATLPLDPARDGFSFIGWFEEDATEKYDFKTSVNSDLILYAHWKPYEVDFYLAGSFSGYQANDDNFAMKKAENGFYTITIELTDENRDDLYDGHYYKITDGTWENAYGVDYYYLDPAPASPTGGGLGSIWHWANGELTVRFDSKEMIITDSLEMKEDLILDIGVLVYGEFNNWALSGEQAFSLTDEDGDGIYTGTIVFEEAGISDFAICLSKKYYDDQLGQRWEPYEQYKFDGTLSQSGKSTTISYQIGTYVFSYYSTTKITEYTKIN